MARQRAYLLITIFALLLVLFPFLFWYGTWFGRKLSDAQMGEYLSDRAKPRHAQHALVQLGERMARRDPGVARWYPQVVQLAASPLIELRQTAAWIMGQDHTYAPFHEVLVKLTADPQPMVRRNAALALSNFGDPAARPELMAMLRPYTIVSPPLALSTTGSSSANTSTRARWWRTWEARKCALPCPAKCAN